MIRIEPQEFAQKSETVSRKFGLDDFALRISFLLSHYSISQTVSAESEKIFKKPQMNADERRLFDLDFQQSSDIYLRNEVTNSPQSSQRTQSTTVPRMKRIFTDIFNPCAYEQTVFHPNNPDNYISAFIRVHLRLAELYLTPQQRARSMAAVIFASFALSAVRLTNNLNELSRIARPSAFIRFHPRSKYRMAPAEGL